MTFQLNLHITGLCGIVPIAGAHMVVLPNARDYNYDGTNMDPCAEMDRHIAILCVQAAGAQITTTRRSFFIPAAAGLATMDLLAFPLDQEDLQISPVLPAADYLPPSPLDTCPTMNHPVNDIAWVANMSDLQAGKASGTVTGGPFPRGLAVARLSVTAGIWTTEALAVSPVSAQDPTRKRVRWYYADMNGAPHQPPQSRVISDVIKIQIPIPDPNTVTFTTSRAGSNVAINGGGNDVDAYLANVPLTTLLGAPTGIRGAEMHFMHFFRLVDHAATPYIPTPDINGANCGDDGSGTQLTPHCPPTQFGG